MHFGIGVTKVLAMKFEQRQSEIETLIEQSDLEQAKYLLIECLNDKPNNLPAYHLLGTVFEKTGAQSTARECFLGRLPESVQQQEFAFDPARLTKHASQVSHLPGHCSTVCSVSSESVVNHPGTKAYSERQLESKATGVRIATSASLWYDGLNTVLFDSNDQIDQNISSINIAPVCNAISNQSPNYYEGQVILMGAQGSNNYYHWLADVLPKLDVLRKSGVTLSESTRFVFTNVTQKFQIETLNALGISADNIVETWVEGCYIRADEIVVPYLSNDMGLSMGAWLPEFIKGALLEGTEHPSKKILISRDLEKSHGRGINNISQFNQHYLDLGYELVVPEHYSVKQQAAIFAGASAIAGAHGAGMANLLFCQSDASVLEVFGPHFAPCYWAISELNKLRYRNIDCSAINREDNGVISQVDQAKTLSARRSQNFTVPIDAL